MMQWLYKGVKDKAIREREKVFVDSSKCIRMPCSYISNDEVKSLLKNNSNKGRSITRKLIEYFHTPIDCHVENINESPLYTELLKIIYPNLMITRIDTEECINNIITLRGSGLLSDRSSGFAVIRDEIIVMMVDFFHLKLFGKLPSLEERDFLSQNVVSFKESISFIKIPDEKLRAKVLKHITTQFSPDVITTLRGKVSVDITNEQIAKIMMGVFFHTGVLQIAEFVAHTIVGLAQNPVEQQKMRLRNFDKTSMQNLLNESLRLYPLFGVTNRVTEEKQTMASGAVIDEGANLIFDFVKLHQVGFTDPERFDPDRWNNLSTSENCYIPFGVGKRMCPAKTFALNVTTVLTERLLRQYSFVSSIHHDRPMTGGGRVYFSRLSPEAKPKSKMTLALALIYIDLTESWFQRRAALSVIINSRKFRENIDKLDHT
ncbi:TPA: cytochrome P450 [Klebsiella oxytoca]|nr:cytochrome P450 [Klebsiella oxytoca]